MGGGGKAPLFGGGSLLFKLRFGEGHLKKNVPLREGLRFFGVTNITTCL